MTNVLKKIIGYGYTDSNGIATLDYTEDGTDITTLQPTGETGYIGNGVGSVQIGAEIHDNSILVSQPYNIVDAKLYIPNEETITFEKTYKYDASASDYQWEYPFCLEFDIKQTRGSGNQFRIRAYQENSISTNAIVRDLSTIGISDNEYHHIKWLIYQNKGIEQLDDGVEREFTKNFTENLKVNFTRYNSTDVSATVKNLRIYLI